MNDVEKTLLEQRAKGMTEWKEMSNPVKEWISKHEKKIQSHSVVRTDHDAVVKQKEDIEVCKVEVFNKRNREPLQGLRIFPVKLRQTTQIQPVLLHFC